MTKFKEDKIAEIASRIYKSTDYHQVMQGESVVDVHNKFSSYENFTFEEVVARRSKMSVIIARSILKEIEESSK